MRIRELRESKGISQTMLGYVLGVTRSTICQYEKGNRQPDPVALQKLADYFGVSVDYLLGRSENKKSPVFENEVQLNDIHRIPIYGHVVAGVPLMSEENLEGYIQISYTPPEEYFALRVAGDSMINAGIRDKSVLVVHKQPDAKNGDIVVALINGEATVKRFKVYGKNYFLMPENPAYEPIPVIKDASGNADFLILGKVVEVRIMF